MGKIDVCDKTYFSDKRRFADFINVHIYQKRKTVFPKVQRAVLATLKMDVVIAKREKEDISMCRAFEELLQDQWEEGRGEGENLLAELLKHLLSENRNEDVKLAICDTGARKRFYQEYGML